MKIKSKVVIYLSLMILSCASTKFVDKKQEEVKPPRMVSGASINGPRTKQNILQNIISCYRHFRKEWNNKKVTQPNFEGRIDVEFEVDQEGNVINHRIINSTTDDTEFDKKVISIILMKNFGLWPKTGNTTIVYPIVFSE